MSATPWSDNVAPEHAPPGFLSWVASLVHTHRRELLNQARRSGLGTDDALDAVQEAFVSFMQLPQARDIAKEGDDSIKLLSVILRHSVNNGWRKRRRRAGVLQQLDFGRLEEAAETSQTLIERAEEVGRLRGCIRRMARLQRQVIRLSLLDEQAHELIAADLGITEGYVRVLLHRAREHLRQCDLEHEAPEEGPDHVD